MVSQELLQPNKEQHQLGADYSSRERQGVILGDGIREKAEEFS